MRSHAAYSSFEQGTRVSRTEPRPDPMRGIMVSIALGSLAWGAFALLVLSVRSLFT